jgi:hypothetical protein
MESKPKSQAKCTNCTMYQEVPAELRTGREWIYATGYCNLKKLESKKRKTFANGWCDQHTRRTEVAGKEFETIAENEVYYDEPPSEGTDSSENDQRNLIALTELKVYERMIKSCAEVKENGNKAMLQFVMADKMDKVVETRGYVRAIDDMVEAIIDAVEQIRNAPGRVNEQENNNG